MTDEGQILNYLENCLANNSLAHAYLFLGPAASGRMRVVEDFLPKLVSAKNLNHPDIKIVAPDEGTVKIEQIRGLRYWLGLSPLAGQKKAVVITQAERMNTEAQNAFLKALEEPVPSTYIFLLAGHARQLLPTIVSRVVPIYFPGRQASPSEAGESKESALFRQLVTTQDLSARLRLWLQIGPSKDAARDWLYKIIPELRCRLWQTRSPQLAKTIRSILQALSGPSGQNWQLIAENLVITL